MKNRLRDDLVSLLVICILSFTAERNHFNNNNNSSSKILANE